MADGDSTNISEIMGSLSDSVLKPLGAELKEMGKVASNSVTASSDPEAEAKKQQTEMEQKQKDAKAAAYQRDFLAKLAEEEAKARQAALQRDQEWAQRNQVEKEKDEVKKFEENKKAVSVNQAVYNAERTKEQRNGVGG
jgi:hypothetical protein